MKKLIIILFILCFSTGCSLSGSLLRKMPESPEVIRVLLLRDVDRFDLQVKSRSRILSFSDNQEIGEINSFSRLTIYANENGIQIEKNYYPFDRLKIIPQRDGTLFINGRSFRGEIEIIKEKENLLMVINSLGLEKYIKGVLRREISDRWPLEVIKAQAVAARTYALYSKEERKGKLFDVRRDIYSQVYGGRMSERYRTNLGVDRTRGQVLVYQKKYLPAYYHATCAGHTENVANLWGNKILPLRGVECSFCKRSPHYSWKRNLRLKNIQEKLNANGYNLSLIKEIQVLKRNKSNRIEILKIIMRNGKEIEISGKDFRQIIGPNVIKSNNYFIEMKGYYVDFIGKGWGHGVGLCQWGANFMSREGYRHDQILKYYYPGAHIIDCYNGVEIK